MAMVAHKTHSFAEESAEVEVLLASLGKTKELAKRIAGSKARLDDSGRVIQDAVGPIYNNTHQLEVMTRNIDRVNEAIERLRQPLDARGREEGIIKAGPKATSLPQYLGALVRVEKALNDLNSSKLRSNQSAITEFNKLLTLGVTQLHDVYRDMLNQDAKPIEPLHYTTKKIPFPTLPPEKAQQLGQMANAIKSAGAQVARATGSNAPPSDDAGRMYAEIRSEYVFRSLKNLSQGSLSTAKRKQSEADVIYRPNPNSSIKMYAEAIEGMFTAEHDNTLAIFKGDASRIFGMTTAKALKTFTSTLSDLNNYIKTRVLTDSFMAYEIIDTITPIIYKLESRIGQLKTSFTEAISPIRQTARTSLTEMIVQTRQLAEYTQVLPSDGNTVPLASQTAQRLQNLAIFERALLPLLASIGDGNWRSAAGAQNTKPPPSSTSSLSLSLDDPSNANPSLLSHYLLDLLSALIDTLAARAQTLHRTKPLQGIFLLNTLAIITRAIKQSPELGKFIGVSPHTQRIDNYRKNFSSLYLAAWREPSAQLLDTVYTANQSSSVSAKRPLSGTPIDSTSIIKGLSSKDKDNIKNKFRVFNTSFDELVARHKSLYMEKEVKNAMNREIQAMIEPLYTRFWDRYHDVDKGKGKVVRYSKGELSTVLAGL